jgi:hypothetical protein
MGHLQAIAEHHGTILIQDGKGRYLKCKLQLTLNIHPEDQSGGGFIFFLSQKGNAFHTSHGETAWDGSKGRVFETSERLKM